MSVFGKILEKKVISEPKTGSINSTIVQPFFTPNIVEQQLLLTFLAFPLSIAGTDNDNHPTENSAQ